MQRQARLTPIWATKEGFDKKQRRSVDHARLETVTIIGDEIHWKAFNCGVNCHQMKLRLNSTMIFTVTATSEGLFAPLEGCLCLLGAVIIVLHSFFAQYFEPSIVYIISVPAEIPRCPIKQLCTANNDVFSFLWHQLHVRFPPLGVLLAVLDDCTVWTTWEQRSVLRDARGLTRRSGVGCKSNAPCCKLSSPRVQHLVSRLVIHDVPGGCARWRLGHFVFVNQHNAGYGSKSSYLSSWTKKSQELEYIYPFIPPTPSFSFPILLNTPPASWTISTSWDWHKTMPLVPKHTR